VGKPEGKIPSGRPGLRLEDNIKTYLQEVGYRDVNGIAVAQDRALVNTGMNICVPYN
jgi:hypothetical protein